MIIRPVMIGDNRFSMPIRRNFQPLVPVDLDHNCRRSLWTNCAQKAPQFYPQEIPRYPARVLNRAVKSSWMRGSLSRSSRMRLQACMTVV